MPERWRALSAAPPGATPDHEGGGQPDGAAPKPALCHSGGRACADGVPCCGGYTCTGGSCQPPDGSYCEDGLGRGCEPAPCCQGLECTTVGAEGRCTIAKTCTKEGSACADDGNCAASSTAQAPSAS